MASSSIQTPMSYCDKRKISHHIRKKLMSTLTMQAVRFHDYGGPEVLMLDRAPRPRPQADQVLMRVLAAGVNPVDGSIRAGFLKEFMPLPMPWIPGLEGVGIVEAVGENVTAFQPGQSVFGFV